MVGWNFPSNGGGAVNGIADSGIEIFRGKEIPSLARETCQNSLDAAVDDNAAVTVEFHRHDISPKDIPDVNVYEKVLRLCLAFWNGNRKAAAFLQEAILKLKITKTSAPSVLRVSDFNTTGLAAPFNARAMNGWNTLTKINGGTLKSDNKAGNFGIGKNAPFANSFFRMVFYRTLNVEGECAAQVVAKLVSFNIDDKNIAAGTGYYGETQGNMPVKKIPALEKIFRRTETGTDVFVYGFNGDDDWERKLIDALIENFLVAIYRDGLRVKVQGRELTVDTLGKFVTDAAANYYKILTGGADIKIFTQNFHDMGTLKLGVLLDPTAKLNRRVLIVRKSGMKLFELDRFSRTLNFTAILELEGLKLNAFFRDMETPDHTNWEPSRHPTNRKDAKKYLDELKRWVREKISHLAEKNISDEVDVPNVIIMPDNNSDPSPAIIINPEPRVKKSPPRKKISKSPKPKQPDLFPSTGEIKCDRLRVIKIGEQTYRLILKFPRTIQRGRIKISALGETNTGEKIFVTQAVSADSNSIVYSADGEIKFSNLRGSTDAKITFELPEDKHYALEVAVHED